MKFKVFLFSFIILFSSVFTFGDAFFMEVKNEFLGVQSIEHHHVDGESHEKEHANNEHSEDCEDECHFCLISGMSNTFFIEITQIELPLKIEKRSQNAFYYLLLRNENYLEGIWQPPRCIS